mgnify:CR=1 FL=1
MKKLKTTFFIIAALFFAACNGDDGVDGRDGKDAETGTVIEIKGNFVAPDYFMYYELANAGVKVYNGDAVLVYVLWEVKDGNDVWRLLPQTVYFNDGELQYNYTYTLKKVEIFMEGTTTLSALPKSYLNDQVFRIVVMPAVLAEDTKTDLTNYSAVMNVMDANSIKINNITLEK